MLSLLPIVSTWIDGAFENRVALFALQGSVKEKASAMPEHNHWALV